MARLTFGMPHRDVVRELKRRGCELVRTSGAREIWKTPGGITISIMSRREISSADAMRMNQALESEGMEEVRVKDHLRRRRPVESPRRFDRVYEPPKEEPKVVEETPKEPEPLRNIFYRRLLKAKKRNGTSKDAVTWTGPRSGVVRVG